jgi:hypothetical protein
VGAGELVASARDTAVLVSGHGCPFVIT